jgi:hypothetical protein
MDAMKILSELNVVFSLIGSAVMTPAFAEAGDFESNALVSEYEMPKSGSTVGGEFGRVPSIDSTCEPLSNDGVTSTTLAPTDLWIEALKVPTARSPDQNQHEAVAGMPGMSIGDHSSAISRPFVSRFHFLPLSGLAGLPNQQLRVA